MFFGTPPDGDPVSPYVRNASEFPVHNVNFWYYDPGSGSRVTGPDTIGDIMPCETRIADRAFRRAHPDS